MSVAGARRMSPNVQHWILKVNSYTKPLYNGGKSSFMKSSFIWQHNFTLTKFVLSDILSDTKMYRQDKKPVGTLYGKPLFFVKDKEDMYKLSFTDNSVLAFNHETEDCYVFQGVDSTVKDNWALLPPPRPEGPPNRKCY